MKKPVVTGDSHSNLSFDHDKFIWLKGFDGYTLWNMDKPNRFRTLRDYCRKYKGHRIYLTFGEIDCRMHITRCDSLQMTYNKYIHLLKRLRKENHDVWIVSISPQSKNIPEGFFGASFEQRKENVEKFNRLLMKYKRFINIYDELVDENGIRKKEYVLDSVHCNSKLGDIIYRRYHEA